VALQLLDATVKVHTSRPGPRPTPPAVVSLPVVTMVNPLVVRACLYRNALIVVHCFFLSCCYESRNAMDAQAWQFSQQE
jgi:hypothetical protein